MKFWIFIFTLVASCAHTQSRMPIKGKILNIGLSPDSPHLLSTIQLTNQGDEEAFVFQNYSNEDYQYGKYYLYYNFENRIDSILLEKGAGKTTNKVIKLAPSESIDLLLTTTIEDFYPRLKALDNNYYHAVQKITDNIVYIKFIPNTENIKATTKVTYKEAIYIYD